MQKYNNREIEKLKNTEIEKYKNTKIGKYQGEIWKNYSVENAAFENNIFKQKILFLFIKFKWEYYLSF